MAHVHKAVYTIAIPPSTERCSYRKRLAVRWKGRKRQWVYGLVCKDNPNRCRVESAKWYITYLDENDEEQTVPGYEDKAATESRMAELVRTAARIQAKLLPPEAAVEPAAMSELLDEFEQHLIDDGRSNRYAHDRKLYVERVANAAGAERPADLTPARVTAAVATVRRELSLSPLTAGYHVSAAKQFTRWLAV